MFVKKECIYLGKIIRTHGIHGDLVLATELTLDAKNKEEPILIELDGGLVPFYLAQKEGLRIRDHQSYLIRFDHTENKEQAEPYVGVETYLLTFPNHKSSETSLPKEPSLLKGYSIYDENNKHIGEVDDVLDFSGNILIRIFIQDKEILLPFTEDHIINWHSEQRTIQLHIPEGLLNL